VSYLGKKIVRVKYISLSRWEIFGKTLYYIISIDKNEVRVFGTKNKFPYLQTVTFDEHFEICSLVGTVCPQSGTRREILVLEDKKAAIFFSWSPTYFVL
jgi:hypothetical protein